MVTITYFVHGTTTDNLTKLSTGWNPGELSDKGIQQGIELSKTIKDKYFDVVFEVSGSKTGAASMTKLAKISGMVVIVGMAGDNYPVDLMSVFTKQLKLQGVRIHTQEAFAAAVDILVSGELNDQLYKLISKTFALEDIKAAFEYMHTNTDHFKILLEV